MFGENKNLESLLWHITKIYMITCTALAFKNIFLEFRWQSWSAIRLNICSVTQIIRSRCLNSGSPPTRVWVSFTLLTSITASGPARNLGKSQERFLWFHHSLHWIMCDCYVTVFSSPWDRAHLFLHLKSQWQIFAFRPLGLKAKYSSAEREALPCAPGGWDEYPASNAMIFLSLPPSNPSEFHFLRDETWPTSQSPSSQGVLSLESGNEIINKRDTLKSLCLDWKVSLHSGHVTLDVFNEAPRWAWLTEMCPFQNSKNQMQDRLRCARTGEKHLQSRSGKENSHWEPPDHRAGLTSVKGEWEKDCSKGLTAEQFWESLGQADREPQVNIAH